MAMGWNNSFNWLVTTATSIKGGFLNLLSLTNFGLITIPWLFHYYPPVDHISHIWLVVLTIFKNMNVNVKDDIPYMKRKIKLMIETTNQIYIYIWIIWIIKDYMDYISHISHIKGPINVPPPPATATWNAWNANATSATRDALGHFGGDGAIPQELPQGLLLGNWSRRL